MGETKSGGQYPLLSDSLGYSFQEPALLAQALSHASYTNEKKVTAASNERLEFLGDAVLQLVVSQYLYRQFPACPEGELTRLRAEVVCEPTLARRAQGLGLGEYLRLGRGEENAGGRTRASILADAFEAVIGALYLDGGLRAAKKMILQELAGEITAAARGELLQDHKTRLQEQLQRRPDCQLAYSVIGETGPDHAKSFCVRVSNGSEELGTGTGKSKKEAEQAAAAQALLRLTESE